MRCQRAVNQPAKRSDNYLREVFKFYDNERLSQISEIVDLHNYCIGFVAAVHHDSTRPNGPLRFKHLRSWSLLSGKRRIFHVSPAKLVR